MPCNRPLGPAVSMRMTVLKREEPCITEGGEEEQTGVGKSCAVERLGH